MLNYWLTPICADNDTAMMHSLSTIVNNQQSNHAITQAPHHYDLYLLGEVTEDGGIKPKKEWICEASHVIRTRAPGPDDANLRRPFGRAMATPAQDAPGASATGERQPSDADRATRDANGVYRAPGAPGARREGLRGDDPPPGRIEN